MSNLRNRFITFQLFLSLVPVIILGVLVFSLVNREHQRNVALLEQQLVEQKIQEISKFFADHLNVLDLKVSFDQINEIALPDQEFIVEGFLGPDRAFQEVSFFSLQGLETMRQDRLGLALPLRNVSGQAYFQAVVQGQNFIGLVWQPNGEPMMVLASPVRNRNGQIIQGLSGSVSLKVVSNSVSSAQLGNQGYLALIDRSGTIIASGSSADLVGTKIGQLKSGRYTSLISKTRVIGTAKTIPEIGWTVLAEWPARDADALITGLRAHIIWLLLLTGLTALFLVVFFIDKLIKPIGQLQSATEQVAKGNLEAHVKINTNDELEELGRAFNKMTQGLKRLRELQNEFVFIAAHELRTPVTAIKWALDSWSQKAGAKSSEGRRQSLAVIRESSQRLLTLVDEILTIARAQVGKLAVRGQACDITESIERAGAILAVLARERQVTLSYNRPDNLPKVWGDPQRLEQIATNLVSNAVRYNHPGGWVRVRHELTEKEIITHVQDNGLGIDPEDQAHIFEKFFRAKTAKLAGIEGTGLGLFISKELVERLSGRIWFVSQKGQGSTFSFALPKA